MTKAKEEEKGPSAHLCLALLLAVEKASYVTIRKYVVCTKKNKKKQKKKKKLTSEVMCWRSGGGQNSLAKKLQRTILRLEKHLLS